ncbi:hypothetical protein CYLTODRAFT_167627 [Cylindrobasidium torrendii FP15055 ss-10]|uniref:Uncharacterized protein n=1 Tax=Cylindrobasidium torrendii FP15055 ss-10 TaxID=1314674 RepID=A0A0D7BJW1_9AGAR|nr:hypothetical protein CYLTODRAFT_167627 [Cylindrobasidium torrendii FP15055 ss-10]
MNPTPSSSLQSFDPFATHPFTSFCSPSPSTTSPSRQASSPIAAPVFRQAMPGPPPPPKANTSNYSTSPTPRSVFMTYVRDSSAPELDQILKKKPTSAQTSPMSSPPSY